MGAPAEPDLTTAYPRREVHVTDAMAFHRCRRLWDYSSHMRKNLERIAPVLPFFSGKHGHDALQAKYETGADPAQYFEDAAEADIERMKRQMGPLYSGIAEELNEQVNLMTGVLSHYGLWQRDDKSVLGDANLKWIATELSGKVPLFIGPDGEPTYTPYADVDYGFRMDGLVERIDDGSVWIFETKTCRSIEERKKLLPNDPQAAMYMFGAEKILGIRPVGIIYNLLRKKTPTPATELQATVQIGGRPCGQLSQAKNQDTTFEYYKRQLKDLAARYGVDEAAVMDYHIKMLQALNEKGNTFFERYEVRKSPTLVANAVDNLRWTADQMFKMGEWAPPTGAGNLSCIYCHFRAPCLIEDAGGDPTDLLAEQYQQRRPWEDIKLEDL